MATLREYINIIDEADQPVTRPTDRLGQYDYEEVPKTKKDPTNIDAVIVYLKGKRSEVATKLATRFRRVDRIEKLLEKEREFVRSQIMDTADELFPVTDDVFTRLVDTVSMVFKIGKAEASRKITSFDADGYIAELEEMFPDLEKSFVALRKKYTTVSQSKPREPKVLQPKYKDLSKEKPVESVTEGMGDAVISFIKRMLSKWDRQFADLSSRINARI